MGKYIETIGRRKTATARVRLFQKGKGAIMVNGVKFNKYFADCNFGACQQPLKLTGHTRDFNISVITSGGGKNGQLDAVRHGIARAILETDPESRPVLKTAGFLTRDRRKVERKKPGLRKARKAPQWSKR
ncbi:MAG: 30S ribosomal protein S9 [Planctomycetes bacterium]|nr:30S ribosomal protein S9 [Planctomycetota bacterium]